MTTTVTQFSNTAPPIPKNVSSCLVNTLNVLKSELHKALLTFPKVSIGYVMDVRPSVCPRRIIRLPFGGYKKKIVETLKNEGKPRALELLTRIMGTSLKDKHTHKAIL